jgi:hypothetical protein
VRIFRLTGFELSEGQHAARLRLTDEDVPDGNIQRSELWSRVEEGRSELGAALALLSNKQLLFTLGGAPFDSKLQWVIREVGGAGAMDLVALIKRKSGGAALLMVDCMGTNASPAKLREHVAQSVRQSLSTLAKITLTDRPSWTRLVVLAGWRRSVPIPTEAKPLPALQRAPAILETVPEPLVWGYVPFVYAGRDEIHIAVGSWAEFDEGPWGELREDDVVPLPWQRWGPVEITDWGKGAVVELEQHRDTVRVSLRLRSSAHKASLKKDRHGSRVANRVRALRTACYSGHMRFGAGRFVGETIEDGVPRLHWDWPDGQAPSAEAARDTVISTLRTFGDD